MSSDRPVSVRLTCAAIDRHRASLDAARARFDRADTTDDRMAALRKIEASMSDLGRYIGQERRGAFLRQRARAI